MKLYDFKIKAGNNEVVSMEEYKGKVLLIVNTATGCGFTPQYDGLQALYEQYRDQGFEVLDFPCNQFANQAPGSNEEIHSFCQINFHTTFPTFAKVDVNGRNAEPLFEYLKSQKKSILGSGIKWNFTKFLIDREGNVVERYAPMTKPEQIEKKIKELL